MPDRGVGRPNIARIGAKCLGVEAPRQSGGSEFVTQRLIVLTDVVVLTVLPVLLERSDDVAFACAPPLLTRKVDPVVRLTGDDVLMRDVAGIQVRSEHPVG